MFSNEIYITSQQLFKEIFQPYHLKEIRLHIHKNINIARLMLFVASY